MRERRPFSNRYVFAKVMGDNPDLCREMIEVVLGVDVGRVEMLQVESEETSITHRGVRFDVYLRGSGASFEVEMQTYEQDELPLRMRFYRSQLDRRMLDKGDAFDELKPVYVIFVCLNDHFGRGLPVYTFESTCREDPTVPFDNGVHDVVLNADGDLSLAGPGVAELLRFVATGEPAGSGTLTGRLADAVDDAYRDEEWVSSMDMIEWDLRDARRHAEAEGRAEGLAAGRAEGLERGREEGREAERDRISALLAAMKSAGRPTDEMLAALQSDNIEALYEEYGV